MGDLFEQAQSIWKALDSMSEQDPEAYKKFISEQLKQGRGIFGSKGPHQQDSNKGSKNMLGGTSRTRRNGLEESFGKLEIGTTRTSDSTIKAKPDAEEKRSTELSNTSADDNGEVYLLDDEIGVKPSMLSKIVQEDDQKSSDDKSQINEVMIKELLIPSSVSTPAKSKTGRVLIEEI